MRNMYACTVLIPEGNAQRLEHLEAEEMRARYNVPDRLVHELPDACPEMKFAMED